MGNILTTAEAANALRCDENDANLIDLLPQIDRYVMRATGHDWAADDPVQPEAKDAARMLLVRWHEDPGGMAAGGALGQGLSACLTQLEALALRYFRFAGSNGAGPISVAGARAGDAVTALIGLVGVTGDQSASFESVITYDDEIQQTATGDLSDYWFQAHLTPLGE
jgi:hypothetical protein